MSPPQENEAQASIPPPPPPPPPPPTTNTLLFLLNVTLMVFGAGGPLLLRVYFLHGGARMWLSSLLQVCGWPLLLIPISLSSFHQHRHHLLLLPPHILASSAAIGLLFGLDCYLYAYGSSYLPLSTSSILISTQLSFTALFSFLIVRQRFTAYSINALTLSTRSADSVRVEFEQRQAGG